MMKSALFISICLLMAGCGRKIRESVKEKVILHYSRLKSYQGELREEKIHSGRDLDYRVTFQAPDFYAGRILTPGPFQGSRFCRRGAEAVAVYPSTRFAVKYRNLPAYRAEVELRQLEDRFDWFWSRYRIDTGELKKVAGYETVELKYKPRSAGLSAANVRAIEEYSFPAEVDLRFPGGENYHAVFTSLAINSVSPEERRVAENDCAIPAGFATALWNFLSADLSATQAQRLSNYRLPEFPGKKAGNYSLRRIIRADGVIPAFGFIFEREPYFLAVLTIKDYGVSMIPQNKGVRLGDLTLNFIGSWSMLTWKKNGAHYFLLGNEYFEELLALASREFLK